MIDQPGRVLVVPNIRRDMLNRHASDLPPGTPGRVRVRLKNSTSEGHIYQGATILRQCRGCPAAASPKQRE